MINGPPSSDGSDVALSVEVWRRCQVFRVVCQTSFSLAGSRGVWNEMNRGVYVKFPFPSCPFLQPPATVAGYSMAMIASALVLCAILQPAPMPSIREQVVYLTNLERRKEGMVPLQMADGLMKGAQNHAEDMSAQGYFSHKGKDGSSFSQRCQAAGYRGSPRGENIAMGAAKADQIVEMWMDSPGHRANILNPDITEIGIGFAARGAYAVMCLGVSENPLPVVIENESVRSGSPKVLVYLGGRNWARQMRFSTDGRSFGPWQPHASFAQVDLPPQRGVQALIVEFEGPRGSRRAGGDSIYLDLQSQPSRPPAQQPLGALPSLKLDPKGIPIAEIVFPVLGSVTWSDTFGAPRDGGVRKHMGQDLPAPKMRPILAAFDGVWLGASLASETGLSATYIHLNNDTPGTDDGQGGEEYRLAPGIWSGVKVVAGQFVAYNGDSGNAEETGPHLHFELAHPAHGTFNAAPSLLAAQQIKNPRYVPEFPELLPLEGQVRWDAEVRSVDEAREVIVVDLAATIQAGGKAEGVSALTRRYIKRGIAEFSLKPGDYLAILGPEPKPGEGMKATGIKLLRSRPGLG